MKLWTMFFFLLLPAGAFAEVKCPEPSIAIEYISPATQTKKITCGHMKDGSFIKHGDEVEYDKNGNWQKGTFYLQGKVTTRPELPVQALKEEEEAFAVIGQLLKVLNFQKAVNDGTFRVATCDPNSRTWVKAALTSTEIHKTYVFNDRCDVSGSFRASFTESFPVTFDLRNLNGFTKTKMIVKMSIKQKSGGIRYRFEVDNGTVLADAKSVAFKAEYEVNIDPLTGSTIYDSQEGKITLTKSGDKELNITRPLVFDR